MEIVEVMPDVGTVKLSKGNPISIVPPASTPLVTLNLNV